TRSKRDWSSDVCSSDLLENLRVLGGKGWEALDARRERLSPAAQAPLLGMCRVPSERVAPGDVLRTVGWCGLPRFGRFMAGFPRKIGRASCRERVSALGG